MAIYIKKTKIIRCDCCEKESKFKPEADMGNLKNWIKVNPKKYQKIFNPDIYFDIKFVDVCNVCQIVFLDIEPK